METPAKWRVVIIAIAVVIIILTAAIAYVALLEDEDQARLPTAIIGIFGSDLATSELVDHGQGTLEDPYVITGLDLELTPSTTMKYGIMITSVNEHLIISGSRIHGDYVRPGHEFTGIAVTWSTNVTILDCRFENLTAGVELSYSAVNITYDLFLSCNVGVLIDERSGYGTSHGTVIWKNTFEYSDYCVEGISNWDFTTLTDVLIKNNTMRWYDVGAGMYGLVGNVTIIGNHFYEGGKYAIDGGRLYSSTITDNRMYAHLRDGGGIWLKDCDGVRVEHNSMETLGPAISIQWSQNVAVSNNSIDSFGTGLNPTEFGVFVENSRYVNLTYNRISDRNVGVMILSSSPSSSIIWIHHNKFLGNYVQALYNLAMDVHWDDEAGSGNYWDDYGGSDNNQDGVGDTPYIIDADTQDNYPLMVSPV